MKTISQASAVASAVAKVNGSALAIVQAATQADKARGKLAEQVRDGDVVIAMGAGSIGTVAQRLKDLLEGTR